jgi:hypothetical protein
MKTQRILLYLITGFSLMVLGGCGHQTDEEVLSEAVNIYSSVAGKYHEILNSQDDDAVILYCQRFGRDFRTNSFWYDAHLAIAEIAPLHRALIVIADDRHDIVHLMNKLECRMLTSTTIYEKIKNLVDNLNYAIQVVKDNDRYLEEARVLEQRRLEEERLAESRAQTVALTSVACSMASRPVVVKETVVTRCPKRSCSCAACDAPCGERELEEIIVD